MQQFVDLSFWHPNLQAFDYKTSFLTNTPPPTCDFAEIHKTSFKTLESYQLKLPLFYYILSTLKFTQCYQETDQQTHSEYCLFQSNMDMLFLTHSTDETGHRARLSYLPNEVWETKHVKHVPYISTVWNMSTHNH